MKITNEMNLPTPFVDAVSRDYEYKDKRYSVTSMLKGNREILLTRRHFSEMTQDAADSIWLILGNAVHKILEQSHEASDELKETKVHYEFPNGYTLSGQQDLYSEKLKRITDYKTGSVWKVKFGDWEDYRTQCLYYGLLFRKIGFEVTNAEIVFIMRDWTKTEAKIKPDYPQHPVFIQHFDFTDEDFEEAEKTIINKFNELDQLQNVADSDLPLCTEKERWSKAPSYAVMKKGVKRALKVCESEDEANEFLKTKGDYVEFRPGIDTKCSDYCACCEYCSYWKERYGKETV